MQELVNLLVVVSETLPSRFPEEVLGPDEVDLVVGGWVVVVSLAAVVVGEHPVDRRTLERDLRARDGRSSPTGGSLPSGQQEPLEHPFLPSTLFRTPLHTSRLSFHKTDETGGVYVHQLLLFC